MPVPFKDIAPFHNDLVFQGNQRVEYFKGRCGREGLMGTRIVVNKDLRAL